MAEYKKCVSCNVERPIEKFSFIQKWRRNSCNQCRRHQSNKSVRCRWTEYKRKAKTRGKVFELTEKQFKSFENSSCFYCGDDLDYIRLDRINNDLGYIIDNVVSCCHKCNSFKYTLDKKEFLDHVSKIYLYQKERNENGKQESSFQKLGKENIIDAKGVSTGN
jgi:hypothetical protein